MISYAIANRKIKRRNILEENCSCFHKICIFAVNSEDTCACCEKYSNKFDVSHPLIRIFAIDSENKHDINV